jgi:hypothetical protein
MTVTHLDGAFGLGNDTDFSAIAGGLFGLVKTLGHEWPRVFCRAVDLSPAIEPSQAVDLVWAELHDPDRRILEVGYRLDGRFTLVAGT